MESHSATKKTESVTFAGKSLELENTILIEITLAPKKDTAYSLSDGDLRC